MRSRWPQNRERVALRRRCEEDLVGAVRTALARVPPGKPPTGPDPLAVALESLLRVRLPERAEAGDYGSPDGVLVRRVDVVAPAALELRGWVIEVGTQSCEPFAARVELTEDGTSLRDYTLVLGDAAKGWQRLRLDSRAVRLGEPTVDEWFFTFTLQGDAAR